MVAPSASDETSQFHIIQPQVVKKSSRSPGRRRRAGAAPCGASAGRRRRDGPAPWAGRSCRTNRGPRAGDRRAAAPGRAATTSRAASRPGHGVEAGDGVAEDDDSRRSGQARREVGDDLAGVEALAVVGIRGRREQQLGRDWWNARRRVGAKSGEQDEKIAPRAAHARGRTDRLGTLREGRDKYRRADAVACQRRRGAADAETQLGAGEIMRSSCRLRRVARINCRGTPSSRSRLGGAAARESSR